MNDISIDVTYVNDISIDVTYVNDISIDVTYVNVISIELKAVKQLKRPTTKKMEMMVTKEDWGTWNTRGKGGGGGGGGEANELAIHAKQIKTQKKSMQIPA